MSEEAKAKVDALADIRREEEETGLIPCYFGSAFVIRGGGNEIRLINILVPQAQSYAEAVGVAYMNTTTEFPSDDKWVMQLMSIEQDPVYVDPARFCPPVTDGENVIFHMTNPPNS